MGTGGVVGLHSALWRTHALAHHRRVGEGVGCMACNICMYHGVELCVCARGEGARGSPGGRRLATRGGSREPTGGGFASPDASPRLRAAVSHSRETRGTDGGTCVFARPQFCITAWMSMPPSCGSLKEALIVAALQLEFSAEEGRRDLEMLALSLAERRLRSSSCATVTESNCKAVLTEVSISERGNDLERPALSETSRVSSCSSWARLND